MTSEGGGRGRRCVEAKRFRHRGKRQRAELAAHNRGSAEGSKGGVGNNRSRGDLIPRPAISENRGAVLSRL